MFRKLSALISAFALAVAPAFAQTLGPTPAASAFVTPTGGSTGSQVKDLAARTLSVTDFNAKCNGSTNDTTAFQAAANSSAKVITVDAGKTCIVGGVTLGTANQRWEIKAGATVKMVAGAGGDVFSITAAGVSIGGAGTIDGNSANVTSSSGVTVGAVSGVTVGNSDGPPLVIQNAKYDSGAGGGYGVYAHDAAYLTVSRTKIVAVGNDAIFEQLLSAADVAGVRLVNNIVDRTASGIGIIEGGIKLHGYATHANGYTNPVVTGNLVILPTSPTLAPPVDIEIWDAKYAVIGGNTTYGGTMGLSLDHVTNSSVGPSASYGPSIYCFEFATSSYVTATGLACDGASIATNGVILDGSGSDHIALGDVTVHGTTGAGIKAQTSTHLSVTNPVVRVTALYGIELLNTTDFTVVGGELDGAGTAAKGIFVEDSWNGSVAGANIHDFTQNGVLIYGSTTETLDYISVSGNSMRSCGSCVNTQLSGGAVLGSNIRLTGNIGAPDYLDLLNNTLIAPKPFAPGGVITAGIGSVVLQTNGAASSTLWVKESGTGNTGWSAVMTNPGSAFTQGANFFANSTGGLAQDVTKYCWDATNHRLGIGLCAPTQAFHLRGTGTDQLFLDNNTAATISVNQSSPQATFQGHIWNTSLGTATMAGFLQVVPKTSVTNPTVAKFSFGLGTDNVAAAEKGYLDSNGVWGGSGADIAGALSDTDSLKVRNTTAANGGAASPSNKLWIEGRAWNSGLGDKPVWAYLQYNTTTNNANPTKGRLSIFVGDDVTAPTERWAITSNGGHLLTKDVGVPALTSCGTSPAISGSDSAGEVTTGTGTPTSCTLTFSAAFANSPYCVVSAQTLASLTAYAVTTTTITFTTSAVSSLKIDYHCIGS